MRAFLLGAVAAMLFPVQAAALAAPAKYSARLELLAVRDEMFAGRLSSLVVRVENRGNLPWPSSASDPLRPVRLAYHWLDERGRTVVYDGLRTELPRDLAPGERTTISMTVLPPRAPGSYALVIDLVREHVTWFSERGSQALTLAHIPVRGPWTVTGERLRLLLLTGASVGLLWLMGFGTARLAASAPLSGLPVPLLGASLVIAGGYYAAWLGVPMATAKWLLLALGGILAVSALRRQGRLRADRGDTAIAAALGASALILALLPLWNFGRPSTVLNTYSAYFTVMSEYWKTHYLGQLPALDPYRPLDYLVRERLEHGTVSGTPFLNAFVASTLGVDSYETYSILTALLLALLPPSLYWTARSPCGLTKAWALFVSVLGLVNITYFLWNLRGQLPFVAGLVFLPVALATGTLRLTGQGRSFPAALLLSALLAVYTPLAPYALLPLALVAGFLLFDGTVAWRGLALRAARLLGLVVVINPVILFLMAMFGLATARQISENWHNIPGYPAAAELLGLLPHFTADAQSKTARILTSALVLLVFLVAGFGLLRAVKDRRWLLPATVLAYTLGALAIAILMDYAYGFYKHGVVTLFAILLAFASGLDALWRRKRGWRLLAAVAGGGVALACLLTYGTTAELERPAWVSPQLASLKSVRHLIKDEEVVLLDEIEVGRQLWASYFLRGVRLSVPPALEPWGWWGFSSVSGRGDPSRFYHDGATHALTRWNDVVHRDVEPVFSNATYRLVPGHPLLRLGSGWHALEEGTSSFRWMAQEGRVLVHGERLEREPVRLRMSVAPITAPVTLEVFLGEQQLDAFVTRDASRPWTFTTRPFVANGKTAITIRSVEGCVQPSRLFGTADTRCLSARFYDLRLIREAR